MIDLVRDLGLVLLATLLAGVTCGWVGFFLTHMRLPFMGVCLSHAALVGALLGHLLGLPIGPTAFVVATLAGLLTGPVADSANIETTSALGILFSAMMALAFFLVGLIPGPKSEALGLIWGSVLFVGRRDIWVMLGLLALVSIFVAALDKELKALLFSREMARLVGIRERVVFYGLLLVAAAVVSAHLDIVGGVMLYGLLVIPASAASLLGAGYRGAMLLSGIFGGVGSVGGVYLSYAVNVPTGASIVLTLGLIFGICWLYHRRRERPCRG